MNASAARSQRRLVALCGVAAVGFLVLMGQLWWVQIANGAQYRQRADVNRIRVVSEKPLRGVVYDRAGRQIARNVPSFGVFVRPADLPRGAAAQAALFERLGQALEMGADEVKALVDAGRGDPFTPTRVKVPVPRDLALILEERQASFPGLVID